MALALAELTVRVLEACDLLPGESGSALVPEVEYSGKFKLSTNKVLIVELDPEDPFINFDGFRDREFPPARSAAKRIMMLGDSVTFGRGVAREGSFPKLLEEILNRNDPAGPAYEVMNFGAPGYNTRQELEFFEGKGRTYAPDLLVIFSTLLDVEHYPYHRLHQRVAQEARRYGFPVLDLFESFESHAAVELALLPGDTTHPGPSSHRLAAERIHASLRQAGLPRKRAGERRPPAAPSPGSPGPGD